MVSWSLRICLKATKKVVDTQIEAFSTLKYLLLPLEEQTKLLLALVDGTSKGHLAFWATLVVDAE